MSEDKIADQSDVVEVNENNVREIAVGIMDYLDTVQEKYNTAEIIYAIFAVHGTMVETLEQMEEDADEAVH